MQQQIPPWFYRPDGNPYFAANMLANNTVFLVCGGPSINTQPLHVLSNRGIITCGVNNVTAVHRTQLWVSVDPVKNFSDAIWRDPGILKFCPLSRFDEQIVSPGSDGELATTKATAGEMPNVVGYHLAAAFRADSFLSEPGFCLGCGGEFSDSLGNSGARSVLLVALKLLYVLGAGRVFLLGCDFRMQYGKQNYAFPQERSRSSVRGNNRTYRVLNERFTKLRPYFEQAEFEVINCTPNSGLVAFPKMEFERAVELTLDGFPPATDTLGRYEWKPESAELDKDDED